MSRNSSKIILSVGLIVLGAAAWVYAGPDLYLHKPSADKPSTVEMIIKFKDQSSIGPNVEALYLDRERMAQVTELTYIEELNHLFKLRTIDRLFGRDPRSLEEVIHLFPERSKRRPSAGSVPSVGFTYRFVFEEGPYIIEEICEAYQDSPDVEYAHPNFLNHSLD